MPEPPGAAAGDEGSVASLEPARILVVEDNVELRAYLRQLLAPLGRVLEAEDGAEGLERAREELPDLIVADVMMPRLDGLAMSRALHEDPRTDGIPVLFLTARAAASHEAEALRTGADDYVTKPFTAEVLRARAAGLMARRQRLRERLREELERELGAPRAAAAAEPGPAPGSPLLGRARAAIREHLLDDDFQVPDLADALALGRSQLHRRLKSEADVTPSQLLMEVRLERAEELLRHREGNVTEVAFAVGFKSLSHFHRCFRQRFGVAPSELLRPGRA